MLLLRTLVIVGTILSMAEAFVPSPSTTTAARTATTKLAAVVNNDPSTRREILTKTAAFTLSTFVSSVSVSNALDMDAFANAQIEADVKNCDPKRDPKCIPKLNADEALCKYGQSGNARGEACKRVKAAGGTVDIPKPVQSLGGAYAM